RQFLYHIHAALSHTLITLGHHAELAHVAQEFLRIHPDCWRSSLDAADFLSHCAALVANDAALSTADRQGLAQRYVSPAKELLEEAIRRGGDDATAHANLAWFLATGPVPQLRDAERALGLARRAVQRAPEQAACWRALGAAHYQSGDWQAAVEALR